MALLRSRLGFVLVFLIQLLLSFDLQRQIENDWQPVRFVPAHQYVRAVSGTFRPLFAQGFYMKGALELAHHVTTKVDYLLALFEVAIRLDARLINAAFLGGLVLPTRRDDYLKANDFLKRVRPFFPNEWRLPYWIGFNYHQIQLNDHAADYYQQAAQLPNAPSFLTTNQVLMVYQTASVEHTIKRAEHLLESVQDDETRAIIESRIQWLKQMLMLENLVREYRSRYGRWPNDLQELVQHGLLREIPVDEVGQGFILESPGDPEFGYRVRSNLPY